MRRHWSGSLEQTWTDSGEVPKPYRRQVFDSNALSWLQQHAKQVLQRMDCKLMACDGEADPLHLLVEFPRKLSVSAMVNAFKGTSSRLLRQARPDIADRYWRKGVLWSPSYFAATTGGTTLETVRKYVEQQRAE